MQKPPGERLLENALEALSTALGRAEVNWMLIGGLAVVARGVRRMTTDIDAVIQGGTVSVESLLLALADCQIVARISNAAQFAGENLVLLLIHEPSGVELDVSLGFTAFEREALEHRQVVQIGRLAVPAATAEDLVVFKSIAARPKDVEDASALLLLHRDIDLARVRSRVHTLAVLAEEPELEGGLEQVIERSHSVRRAMQSPDGTGRAPTFEGMAPHRSTSQRSKRRPRK